VAVDDDLIAAAVALVGQRFGTTQWAGAAAMRLDDGSIVTSTAPDAVNDAVALCHETGALCEAYKLGRSVVASVCLTQRSPGDFLVLAPCGVCQERLFLYGPAVEVGVGDKDGSWRSVRLDELQPYHWRRVVSDSPDWA
jgi:cytidine deaminase